MLRRTPLRGKTVDGGALQDSLNRVCYRTGNAFAKRADVDRSLYETFRKDGLRIRPGEWRLADEHLEKHAAKRV